MTPELLQGLHVRLKVDGYENVGQLLRDYATYKFHDISKTSRWKNFYNASRTISKTHSLGKLALSLFMKMSTGKTFKLCAHNF
jgi:hypothetical protein